MTLAANSLSARTTERPSRAFLRLLAGMCRRSPKLLDWLTGDFANSPEVRSNFLELVAGAELPGDEALDGLVAIAGGTSRLAREIQNQRRKFPPSVLSYGGKSWDEMEALLRRYEARTIPLEVFLFARDWRDAGSAAAVSPDLLRRGAHFLDLVTHAPEKRWLHHYNVALEVLASLEAGKLRAAFGYADWWKLQALVYMMRHPGPNYRTRDVRAHLAKLGLRISSLDFRRFCRRHGIARDKRAGRPRGTTAARRKQ